MSTEKKSIHEMSILIIDDAQNNVSLLKAILTQDGFVNTYTAFSVAQALEILEQHPIDLVLLSFILPELSGMEVCKRITEDMRYEDIAVIMITANTDMQTLKESFRNGAADFISKPINKVELLARVQSHLIRKQVNDERKHSAIIDSLTGLFNRRYFDAMFLHQYEKACLERHPLTFFIIDIDNFKKYNDNYGHQKGDETLKSVAHAFKTVLNRENDYVFRIGGEEFGIILYNSHESFIQALSEELHSAVRDLNIEHLYNENFNRITISIGVASSKAFDNCSKYELYNTADQALYEAKKSGRNHSVITHL